MPMLNRDGVNLYYEVHGQGPAILLTHGFSATSQMWAKQVEAFSAKHTLILWDMRGHGRTDYPEDPAAYSEEATVADMAALLDAVGAEKAVIGGLSLGGYMTMAFHRVHPDRVKALLIIDTGPGYRSDQARQGWNDYALEHAVGYETKGLGQLGNSSEVRASTHRSADGLAKAARGMLTQRNSAVIDSLPGIAVPALVVVGANDKPFLAATDYMVSKIPGAEKLLVPDAGHGVNLDQPEIFNREVLAFLDKAGV